MSVTTTSLLIENDLTFKNKLGIPEYIVTQTNGLTTLNTTSSTIFYITGTAENHSIKLPNGTLFSASIQYELYNLSEKDVFILLSDDSLLMKLSKQSFGFISLKNWDTSPGVWVGYQIKDKGIKTFGYELHYVSGTGLNTTMNNGSFFRVRPGTFASGSYSGYPAAFPLQMPYDGKLFSIVLTFRAANFDYNANSGLISFELETRDHYYNGSDVFNRILVRFGNFSGNSTGHSTWRYELFKKPSNEEGFSYISGLEKVNYGKMIGCRFVKSTTGVRDINSFVDIVMKLNFEEA